MSTDEKIGVKWIIQRGYSIEGQLAADGLSFEAFDLIEASTSATATEKIKGKIISRLAKNLRSDCQEDADADISKIQYGVYCIALGTGFEIDYKKRNSRIVYIGSGSVYGRIKSHLKGKLFEFASALRSVPLRFYIADLTDVPNGKSVQRQLEQALLKKFEDEIDNEFPLLNKRNAHARDLSVAFDKGWDLPLQRERGRGTTNWLLKAVDEDAWKGQLEK
ncbi:MAG: hypothetical protein C0606_03515 [Hyphomicrobiales bacterium]|nr:MAG: hypothetical protein C0606_03515 [Hyphomicrobiales bacterium]